jgi:hypothetical protein
MTIKEQATQTINQASFPPQVKERLLAMLPEFGTQTWSFLDNELSSLSAKYSVKYIVSCLDLCKQANAALQAGDEKPWLNLLDNLEDKSELEYGRYLVFPAVDTMNKMIENGSLKSKKFAEAVLKLEFQFLKELTNDQVLDLCSKFLGFFVLNFDFFEALQEYYSDRVPKQSTWLKQLSLNLKNSTEVFGRSQINDSAATIGYWVQDFTLNTESSQGKKGVFEIIQYINSNPSTSRLSVEEKASLTEILKIYIWGARQPGAQNSLVSDFVLPRTKLSSSSSPVRSSEEPKPTPGIAFNALKEDSKAEEIDRKLSELRKKVNKNQQ